MTDPEQCDLHDAAVHGGITPEPDPQSWAKIPIADECHNCAVCRWARTYIERRLMEQTGRRFPAAESSGEAWRELQEALRTVRSTVRGASGPNRPLG